MPAGNQKTFSFPSAGIDVSGAYCRQKPRQIIGQNGGLQVQPASQQPMLGGYDLNAQPDVNMWASSTVSGINVRGYDPLLNRRRGGSRQGMSQFIPAQPNDESIIQNINYLIGTPGMQQNASGRVVTLVTVQNGNVYYALSGDTSWTATTNYTSPLTSPPLNFTGIMQSAVLNQILWFADGQHWVNYSPLGQALNQFTYPVNSVNTWAPSSQDLLGNPISSVLPVDNNGNLPRLICNWRSRICLAGLLLDPQSIFMSAVGDPTNYDYSPTYTSTAQAVALDPTGPAGYVGDVVTALIPYTNDVLIIGGDHTIYLCNGDPMNGGTVTLVSNAIGMAWGTAWCTDPYGNVYFVSNRTGIYTMVPGQAPVRISQQIEQLLQNIDTGLNTINLIWNDRFQGLNVFITPTATVTPYAITDDNVPQQPVTHFFYEQRTGAWWQDEFANPNHNPLCCCTFDGNQPGDRVPLIGSWDGYVRAIDPFATTDDGWPINSSVMLGPILTNDADDVILYEIQGILGEAAEGLSYNIYAASTAEKALSLPPRIKNGKFGAGRNRTSFVRVAGHAIYIELFSANPWQMEQVRCRIAGSGLGKVRRRAGPY
jgi:hypothetical protein